MDNASTHKQFVQKVGSWSEKEVECWITEKLTSDEDQVKFHNYCQGIKHKPGTKKYQAALLRFVREHSLRDLALVEALKAVGINVVYTPAYHPEFQPIERFWALLKRYFEESSRDKKFEDRVAEAISRIPATYPAACVQSALRRCWEEHAKMVEAACAAPAPAPVIFEDEPPEDDGDSSDDEGMYTLNS